jgi:hypothetical protein
MRVHLRNMATTANSAAGIYFNLPGVAVVRWDPAAKAAHMEWQGWAKPAEFQAANNALIHAIVDHHGSKVLGDSRRIKVIQQTDQDWINREWFPRILAAGLTRMALVIPASGLAKMNIDDMVSRVAEQLDVAYFATLDEARAWLARPATPESGTSVEGRSPGSARRRRSSGSAAFARARTQGTRTARRPPQAGPSRNAWCAAPWARLSRADRKPAPPRRSCR